MELGSLDIFTFLGIYIYIINKLPYIYIRISIYACHIYIYICDIYVCIYVI